MDLEHVVLYELRTLSPAQKNTLRRANMRRLTELVLTPPGELAKKLKTSISDVLSIVEKACGEVAFSHLPLEKLTTDEPTKFTTGDAVLDNALGGGIRTGMVWEISGQSSSGKTQLALQLSLLVQVKPNLGGLSGSACYLTTNSTLPTRRLSQLSTEHPLLSPSVCSLSDVHTQIVPTLELLMHVLNVTFPVLQKSLISDPCRKPIRLIIVDSIFSLFNTADKATSATLFERSKALTGLSQKLHAIASKHDIAIVVINDVTDVFMDTPFNSQSQGEDHKDEILYRDQVRWFGSAHSLPGENRKEAGLGLVWANQVNARIMLTRTNRRKFLEPDAPSPQTKRQRLASDAPQTSSPSSSTMNAAVSSDGTDTPMLVRRLSVVFSSVSAHNSVDFVITKGGVSALSDEISMSPSVISPRPHPGASKPQNILGAGSQEKSSPRSSDHRDLSQVLSRDPKLAFDLLEADPLEGSPGDRVEEIIPSTYPSEEVGLQDGDEYWAAFDDIPNDALNEIDFDAMDSVNVDATIAASQAES